MIILIKKLARWADIDGPVLYGILARFWGLLAGPVTLLLVGTYFTQKIQGFYYTFASLLALQSFVELGLGTVIINFASHEKAHLNIGARGAITGDAAAFDRLRHLTRLALRWYGTGSVILVIGLSIGGFFFFSHSKDTSGVSWAAQWFSLCVLTGLTLVLVPIWSLLEGCNEVTQLYRFRLFQGMLSHITIWIAILLGANLWTGVFVSLVTVSFAVFFLWKNYLSFLKDLVLTKLGHQTLAWRTEILPMQWRIALSWVSGYFVFGLFNPVLFHYHGAEVAGQMGMTWAITGALWSIAAAWVHPKTARFGILIAQRQLDKLEHMLRRTTVAVVSVASLGATVIWIIVYALNRWHFPFALRMLPPLPTALFLCSTVLVVSSFPASTYLRAHKKEPLLLLSMASALLVGSSTWLLGKWYGAVGMAVGYLGINLVMIPLVWLIWYQCRAVWYRGANIKVFAAEHY